MTRCVNKYTNSKNAALSVQPQGLRPHNYCLPVLKREKHREAIMAAATSGSPKFFLGTDSAPHPKGAKVILFLLCAEFTVCCGEMQLRWRRYLRGAKVGVLLLTDSAVCRRAAQLHWGQNIALLRWLCHRIECRVLWRRRCNVRRMSCVIVFVHCNGACAQEAACGCAGIYSAPVALALYAHAFEKANALHRLEGFASHHGADFYGLPRNGGRVVLCRGEPWRIPESYQFGDSIVVPMWSGESVEWRVHSRVFETPQPGGSTTFTFNTEA